MIYSSKAGVYTYPYGKVINNEVNKPFIFLNKDYLDLLQVSNGTNSDALVLLIATTILHEYVHWADANFKLYPNLKGEMGELFEKDAFGGIIYYNKRNERVYYK